MIDKLIGTIGSEATLFESFLGLLQRQQAMLVADDADGLNEVTADMREKLVASSLLAERRERLVEEIRSANAIEGDLDVTRLIDIVDQNQADQLLRLRNLITDLNEKINRARNHNATLLNRSREYIFRMMDMLSRMNNPQATYAPAGTVAARPQNVAMDRRA